MARGRKTKVDAAPVVVEAFEEDLIAQEELDEEFEEEFEDEGDNIEVAESEDGTEDDGDDEFAAAESALTEILGNEVNPRGFAALADVVALSGRVDALAADIAQLAALTERMKDLLSKNLEATAALNRQLSQLQAEPVVSVRVPNAPGEFGAKYAHPTPPAEFATREIGAGDEQKPRNQRERVAAIQARRKQALNGN